jgi:hypothetical protein
MQSTSFEQKQLIADATRDEPEGMAAWARGAA